MPLVMHDLRLSDDDILPKASEIGDCLLEVRVFHVESLLKQLNMNSREPGSRWVQVHLLELRSPCRDRGSARTLTANRTRSQVSLSNSTVLIATVWSSVLQ